MLVDDISLNVGGSTTLARSLSKSSARDPTLKLHQAPKGPKIAKTEDDIGLQPQSNFDDQSIWSGEVPNVSVSQPQTTNLEDLPSEILELIAGYVVGHLGSASTGSSGSENHIKNWNEVMRHPRRKNVADLALISRTWRRLIQERIFRHIKVQGTTEAQQQCIDFFLDHPHLQSYVKHIQVIVPIWEMKRRPQLINPPHTHQHRGAYLHIFQSTAIISIPPTETNQVFQLASKNATMEEIFSTAQLLFPDLCALTIEAGHCKRPPQIKFFRDSRPETSSSLDASVGAATESCSSTSSDSNRSLAILPSVKTLILKGSWNIVRIPADYLILANALPSLQELHCNYHALKTDAYITMCINLRTNISSNITRLSISLDGLYTKQITSLSKWRKVYPAWHVCLDLANVLPQLESLTYTGRVCKELFKLTSAETVSEEFPDSTNTRLKSINLIVNNVCCDPNLYNDATGIQHFPFIEAFEALILATVRSLTYFTCLNQIRIRFIDLDSPAPLLNPTFHLEKGRAWGFWSEEIVMTMRHARPRVRYLGLRGSLGSSLVQQEQEESKRSLSVDHYRAMAHGGVLIH